MRILPRLCWPLITVSLCSVFHSLIYSVALNCRDRIFSWNLCWRRLVEARSIYVSLVLSVIKLDIDSEVINFNWNCFNGSGKASLRLRRDSFLFTAILKKINFLFFRKTYIIHARSTSSGIMTLTLMSWRLRVELRWY